MTRFGIKHQLYLATIIPVCLISFFFAITYNIQFNKHLQQQLLKLGEGYMHQLLPIAQFAIQYNDSRILQGLINASMVNPDVKSFAFYDAQGQLLAYHGSQYSLHKLFTPIPFTEGYIEHQHNPYTTTFLTPVTIPTFNLYAILPLKNSLTAPVTLQTADILGWLTMDIDRQPILIKQYHMLMITAFIMLFGLLSCLIIYFFLAKKIYSPILKLQHSMKKILDNNFDTNINSTSCAELDVIVQGCTYLQTKYLEVMRDIDQQIEVATQNLQENLEQLKKKNISLTLDKKKHAASNDKKSIFIASMAHEVRNSLNGIIGFANILLEARIDNLHLEYIKTIKSQAHDLLVIMNDFLDFSKINADKLPLACVALDMRACIDEVLTIAAPYADSAGLDLIAITAANIPRQVLGDPIRIKQIISNLVNNAIKFTKQGQVLIRTTIAAESAQDYTLNIAVQDTGMGIAIQKQPKLFHAFNQADESITQHFGGSGLGLLICKKLAEQMHGGIRLFSKDNKGSTFVVRIKLKKLAAYEAEKYCSRLNQLKAICFENNQLYLESLCTNLAAWKIECIIASTLQQLRQILTTNHDLSVAFISVYPNTEQDIAKIIKISNIPCILVSKWIRHDLQTLGAHGMLFKPVASKKLRDSIESILQLRTNSCAQHELDNWRTQISLLQPNLLIAEDNSVNRVVFTSLLQQKCKLDLVTNGQDALKRCEQKHYDAIFLDIQMPLLNGIQTAQMIRAQTILNTNTPIVIISASDYSLNRKELQKLAINFYLQKPIYEKQVLALLLKIIHKKQLGAIDWQLCLSRADGHQKLAQEFLQHLVQELCTNKAEFIQLFNNANISGLAMAAHKLYGACCFSGVPQLQAVVLKLEKLAKTATNVKLLRNIVLNVIACIDDVMLEFDSMNFNL